MHQARSTSSRGVYHSPEAPQSHGTNHEISDPASPIGRPKRMPGGMAESDPDWSHPRRSSGPRSDAALHVVVVVDPSGSSCDEFGGTGIAPNLGSLGYQYSLGPVWQPSRIFRNRRLPGRSGHVSNRAIIPIDTVGAAPICTKRKRALQLGHDDFMGPLHGDGISCRRRDYATDRTGVDPGDGPGTSLKNRSTPTTEYGLGHRRRLQLDAAVEC